MISVDAISGEIYLELKPNSKTEDVAQYFMIMANMKSYRYTLHPEKQEQLLPSQPRNSCAGQSPVQLFLGFICLFL